MASAEEEGGEFEALLDGSDEEDEAPQEEMFDLDSLDLSGSTSQVNPALSKSNPILLDMMMDLKNDDELQEKGEEDDEDEDCAPKTSVDGGDEEKREKLVRILSHAPPGIDLFPLQSGRDCNGFLYFSQDSLSLERDFRYSRRGVLLGHGMTPDRVEEILTSRYKFLENIFPAGQSVLICNKEDFKAVMNFLFYSISVCTDRRLSDLMMRTLFELRRNYSFRWDLSLQHVFTVLTNYGVENKAVYNERFYNRPNVGLIKHLELVIKSGQEAEEKYRLPKLHSFLQRRRESKEIPFEKVSAEDFQFCLSRFLVLICRWSENFSYHLDLRYKNNFSHSVVFLYLLLLLGTDKRVIGNSRVKGIIRDAIHVIFDSFSPQHWYEGPAGKTKPGQKKIGLKFNHHNVHKSLARMVTEFFPGEVCPAVINWSTTEGSDRVTDYQNKSDHHLNMIYRISLVPDSYRGNQLRKYLAFMYLQVLAELDNFSLPQAVDVSELTGHLELGEKLGTGIKVIVQSHNFMMTMTLLELYDIIVGYEPDVDFTKDKVEHIKVLLKKVVGWIQRKMVGSGQYLDITNERSVKGMMVREYVDIIENRWKVRSGW